MELNKAEQSITEYALNHYWHYIVNKLSKPDLGDIERVNLESEKKSLDELLKRFNEEIH